MFYAYWFVYGFPDGDLRSIKIGWRGDVLIIKLHIDIVNLVDYDKILHEIGA